MQLSNLKGHTFDDCPDQVGAGPHVRIWEIDPITAKSPVDLSPVNLIYTN